MKALAAIIPLCLLALSCSTTRVLQDGQYRLASNRVSVVGDTTMTAGDLAAYIRQDAGNGGLLGFNPFLYVYNWSERDGIFHKLGTPPVVFDPQAAASSVSNMENHLRYLGYYDAKADTAVTRKGKKVSVEYIVTPGKRHLIDSVVFDIPSYDSFHADFCADTAASLARLQGNFLSEKLLEEEVAQCASRMRNLGYYSLDKNNFSFEADTLPHGTILHYRIREYERNQSPENAVPLGRYTIGDVTVSLPGDLRFRESLLKGITTVRPGQIYCENTVATTYSRLTSLKVFSGVNIEMSQADSSIVDCRISLARSPMQGFKINFEGSSNSSGLMGVSPRFNYFHKNLFHGGEWFNLAFNGDFQFKLREDVQATEFGVSSGISIPRFFGLPYKYFTGSSIPRTDFNASYNHQNRPEYRRHVVSMGYAYNGTTRGRVNYQLYPLRINFVRLSDLDTTFSRRLANNPYMRYSYQNHLDAGITLALYYNSSDEIVPREYHFQRLGIDISGNLLSCFRSLLDSNSDGSRTLFGAPYAQYVRAEYSVGRTWRYGHEDMQAIATRFLIGAGYAYGNSSAMPFEKMFYCGGASSMRGWQARELGPGFSPMDDTFSIPSQTGDIKLEFNLEYRFQLFWKLESAIFVDVGNVWNLRYEDNDEGRLGAFRIADLPASLAADWGAGIRLNLGIILARIDFGMKLRDPSRSSGSRLIGADKWFKSGGNAVHFGIGYPF